MCPHKYGLCVPPFSASVITPSLRGLEYKHGPKQSSVSNPILNPNNTLIISMAKTTQKKKLTHQYRSSSIEFLDPSPVSHIAN